MARSLHRLMELIEIDHFVLYDLGARAGIPARWEPIGERLDVVGFEPDQEEVDRLNRLYASHGMTARFLNCAVGDSVQTLEIFRTRHPSLSSVLKPNHELLKRHTAWHHSLFEVEEVVSVPAVTVDYARNTDNLPAPDFMKLDIQGGELSALEGSTESLGEAFGIEIEVEFAELYLGQPLFSDIDLFLRRIGFQFFDFSSIVFSVV